MPGLAILLVLLTPSSRGEMQGCTYPSDIEWEDVPDVDRDQIDSKKIYRAFGILFGLPIMQVESVGAGPGPPTVG
jgi:hypothetical protein